MDTLGFDLKKIVSGIGAAPLPPVAKNDLRAIGRTNDCILYGGRARYTVNADDQELAELVPKIPASASDRKSTRLNSSHLVISYAVFCLKKKKRRNTPTHSNA